MTHSYVWHDSFMCVTWRIHMCNMTHSYVWHDSFICVTWLIHTSDMTHSYVWRDSFTRVTWLIGTRLLEFPLLSRTDTDSHTQTQTHRHRHRNRHTHTHRWRLAHTYMHCVRHITTSADIARSLWQKEPYKRDNILQQRAIISRSLLIVVTP